MLENLLSRIHIQKLAEDLRGSLIDGLDLRIGRELEAVKRLKPREELPRLHDCAFSRAGIQRPVTRIADELNARTYKPFLTDCGVKRRRRLGNQAVAGLNQFLGKNSS